MTLTLAWLRRRIFGISLEEATFARRGFVVGSKAAQHHLEHIGKTFLRGYLESMEENQADHLGRRLNRVESEYQGFAFEGAAMGLALQDYLMPWRRDRVQAFLAGPGSTHTYMVHVGAGWAYARLRRRLERPSAGLDPLLGWLALDGYGFHEGYFHWQHYIQDQAEPHRVSGYARRVFDQGLGRSLWFVYGADVDRILEAIAVFPEPRRADLWSGVGLACTYAGGVEQATIQTLRRGAGVYTPHLAQGAAFAAGARQRAGNPAEHTDLACRMLCGCSADEAALITEATQADLPHNDISNNAEPAYQVWRQRIREKLAALATVPQ